MSEKSYLERRRDLKNGIKQSTDPGAARTQASPADLPKGCGKGAKKPDPAKSPEKKPGRPKIRKVAKKRAKELRAYKPVRRKFLQDHPFCELKIDDGCTGASTEVHHAAGRENGRLLKEEDFKSACHHCHQVVTEKSREAVAAGQSKSRLGKSR